jgi:hypothetical protein
MHYLYGMKNTMFLHCQKLIPIAIGMELSELSKKCNLLLLTVKYFVTSSPSISVNNTKYCYLLLIHCIFTVFPLLIHCYFKTVFRYLYNCTSLCTCACSKELSFIFSTKSILRLLSKIFLMLSFSNESGDALFFII